MVQWLEKFVAKNVKEEILASFHVLSQYSFKKLRKTQENLIFSNKEMRRVDFLQR
jgi:hypothetical protein